MPDALTTNILLTLLLLNIGLWGGKICNKLDKIIELLDDEDPDDQEEVDIDTDGDISKLPTDRKAA